VIATHYEPGVQRHEVAAQLRDELQLLAQWLGLERVAHSRGSVRRSKLAAL